MRTNLNQPHLANFFKQVLTALHYIHTSAYIHQDIKLANILHKYFPGSTPTGSTPTGAVTNFYIGDFGLASSAAVAAGECGTYGYMAPEAYQKNATVITTDIYAFGISLLIFLGWMTWDELMSPNAAVWQQRLAAHGYRGDYLQRTQNAQHWGGALKADHRKIFAFCEVLPGAVAHLLDLDPKKRPTAQEALATLGSHFRLPGTP